jgi:2-oxoacid dehydrogenase-like protein with E3 subunit-binding domain
LEHPRPTVIPGWEPSPVNLDKENFRFVTDFLLANDSSRSAVASASRFGFQTLSVDCICLYVDTDNIEDLAAVAASSSMTIVIVKADLCNCTLADMETARGLIERPGLGLDKVQLSERKWQLRQNRPQRCVTEVGPFQHGQSISLFAKESKGSVAVFLTPSEQSIAVMVEAKSKGPAEDASRPPPAAEGESQSADVQPDVTGERLQPSLDREPLIGASPTTKALMLEKGVPISPIKGTGRGGQLITKEDVEKYKPSASAAGPTCEDIPLTSMRKTITSRLHDPSTSPVYALTAYHVLPFEEENETRVITPAGVDILTRLLNSKLREDELSFLISRWNQKCGDVKFGEIGTNSEGWRVDFALFSMEDGFRGQNGLFFDGLMVELFLATEKRSPDFTGSNGVIGAVDADEGVICYADGASSGCTAGRVGSDAVIHFQKRSTNIAGDDRPRESVDISLLKRFHPEGENVYKRGDSGCGVFVPVPEMDGWHWVGQVVQIIISNGAPDVALMIPQSEVMRSLKEVTGIEWKLS